MTPGTAPATTAPSTRVGVDIGGTKIAAALISADWQVTRRAGCPTPARQGPAAIVAAITALVEELDPTSSATQVGIGTAGIVDQATGVITASTDAITGWAGTPLRALVADACARRVTVVNDVVAFLVGECTIGAAQGAQNVIAVTVGTGVGGAVLAGGAVVTGRGGAAGHLGHLDSAAAAGFLCPCGRTGHLEAVASGTAMSRHYTDVNAGLSVQFPEVAARAERGDQHAQRVVASGGRALGRALGGLVNTLAPEVVVIGGGVAQGVPAFLQATRSGLAETVLELLADVPLRLAALGDDAAVIGAVAWAEHVGELSRR